MFFFPLYVNHSYIKKVNFQYKMLNHYRRKCRGDGVFFSASEHRRCAKNSRRTIRHFFNEEFDTRNARSQGFVNSTVGFLQYIGASSRFFKWHSYNPQVFLDRRDYKFGIGLHLTSYKWKKIAWFRCFSHCSVLSLACIAWGGFFLRLSVRSCIGCVHAGS